MVACPGVVSNLPSNTLVCCTRRNGTGCRVCNTMLQVLSGRQALALGRRQPLPRLSRSVQATLHLLCCFSSAAALAKFAAGDARCCQDSTVLSSEDTTIGCAKHSLLLTCYAIVWLHN